MGIVGGGFAGLAAAIAFRQHGHDVTVYEKLAAPPASAGGISLAANALACLEVLGVRDRVVTQPWSAMTATIRNADGRVLIRRTLAQFTGGCEFSVVSRAQLIAWLEAKLPQHSVQYSSEVRTVDLNGTVHVGGLTRQFDLVVAADGLRSVVRKQLWSDAPPPRFTGITGWAWTVDRELGTGFGPIWGRAAEFGILPLADGRTYVYGGTLPGYTDLRLYRAWPPPLPD